MLLELALTGWRTIDVGSTFELQRIASRRATSWREIMFGYVP
jgi:hypothetical protein